MHHDFESFYLGLSEVDGLLLLYWLVFDDLWFCEVDISCSNPPGQEEIGPVTASRGGRDCRTGWKHANADSGLRLLLRLVLHGLAH